MFGDRLKQIRNIRHFTQEKLADMAGIGKMSISKYENNKMMPSSNILIKLSEALDVDINYFFREITVELSSAPQFRTADKRDLTNSEQEQIVAEIIDALSRRKEIIEIYNENEPMINNDLKKSVFSRNDIESLAENIRSEWKLGLDPIENLMDSAEYNGFKIVLINGTDRFDAAIYANESEGPIIALKRGVSKGRQRFTLAHEIGHYFNDDSNTQYDNKNWDRESRANRFAAAFLMPKEMISRDFGDKRENIEPVEIMKSTKKYGVSPDALLNRLESLGIIDSKTKKTSLDKYRNTSFKRTADECDLPEKPLYAETLAIRALSEGVISIRKCRELLGSTEYAENFPGDNA